jgi:glucose/arabinose dehydrogenase
MVLFAPDGMLLIGMGDGGSGGDPQGNGQNRSTLLGSLLRIDVSGSPYSIPPDNPFAGSATFRPEIWASGLRNPWRFSVDRVTGILYIADVGQNRLEEVNAIPVTSAAVNYGTSASRRPPATGTGSLSRSSSTTGRTAAR